MSPWQPSRKRQPKKGQSIERMMHVITITFQLQFARSLFRQRVERPGSHRGASQGFLLEGDTPNLHVQRTKLAPRLLSDDSEDIETSRVAVSEMPEIQLVG